MVILPTGHFSCLGGTSLLPSISRMAYKLGTVFSFCFLVHRIISTAGIIWTLLFISWTSEQKCSWTAWIQRRRNLDGETDFPRCLPREYELQVFLTSWWSVLVHQSIPVVQHLMHHHDFFALLREFFHCHMAYNIVRSENSDATSDKFLYLELILCKEAQMNPMCDRFYSLGPQNDSTIFG